jgi:hypothetical protein
MSRRSSVTTAVVTLFAAASLSVSADKERPGTFSMPGSILLFGTYDDLRVVKPDREIRLKAPADACGKYNGGYFASARRPVEIVAHGCQPSAIARASFHRSIISVIGVTRASAPGWSVNVKGKINFVVPV